MLAGTSRWLAARLPLAILILTATLPLESAMAMDLHSEFAPQAEIPTRFTCEGENISPQLRWSGVPDGAQSLVLIVDDPDAPDPAAPQTTWVHWVVYNLPADSTGLPEAATAADLPAPASQGHNGWGKAAYGGPCPPIGTHRYFFKLYALDRKLEFAATPDKGAVVNAMQGHVLEQASLMGRYRKSH